jgi:hypothetical protein
VVHEWGWHGPAYKDGHIVLGCHQAHARYLSA